MFGSVPCVLVSQTDGNQLIQNMAVASAPTTGYLFESNVVAQRLFQYTQLYISSESGTSFSRSLKNVR
jgi:hypothetical protein